MAQVRAARHEPSAQGPRHLARSDPGTGGDLLGSRLRGRRRWRAGIGVLVVAILGMAGVAQAGHSFPDVADSAFFHRAVGWAASSGLTDGYGDSGLFRPELDITRGEVVTLLHRYHETFSPTETLTASVSASGGLRSGIGANRASRISEGFYSVEFDRTGVAPGAFSNLDDCWVVATPHRTDGRALILEAGSWGNFGLRINVWNRFGARADTAFHVVVTCPRRG